MYWLARGLSWVKRGIVRHKCGSVWFCDRAPQPTGNPMGEDKLKPVYPSEILLEEFLKPMNLSQSQMALALRLPARRINEIVQGKRRITADTALHLARYFARSPQF